MRKTSSLHLGKTSNEDHSDPGRLRTWERKSRIFSNWQKSNGWFRLIPYKQRILCKYECGRYVHFHDILWLYLCERNSQQISQISSNEPPFAPYLSRRKKKWRYMTYDNFNQRLRVEHRSVLQERPNRIWYGSPKNRSKNPRHLLGGWFFFWKKTEWKNPPLVQRMDSKNSSMKHGSLRWRSVAVAGSSAVCMFWVWMFFTLVQICRERTSPWKTVFFLILKTYESGKYNIVRKKTDQPS